MVPASLIMQYIYFADKTVPKLNVTSILKVITWRMFLLEKIPTSLHSLLKQISMSEYTIKIKMFLPQYIAY